MKKYPLVVDSPEFTHTDEHKLAVRRFIGTAESTVLEFEQAVMPACKVIVQNILYSMSRILRDMGESSFAGHELMFSQAFGAPALSLCYKDEEGVDRIQHYFPGAIEGDHVREVAFVAAISETLQIWPERVGHWGEGPNEQGGYPFYRWKIPAEEGESQYQGGVIPIC